MRPLCKLLVAVAITTLLLGPSASASDLTSPGSDPDAACDCNKHKPTCDCPKAAKCDCKHKHKHKCDCPKGAKCDCKHKCTCKHKHKCNCPKGAKCNCPKCKCGK